MESAMLPHANRFVRSSELFDSEHQAIALVFRKPSGRISVSPNRAAIPVGRDDGGAVRRDLPGFRVPTFLGQVLLVVCMFALQAVLPVAAPSPTDENKPTDEANREEL